MRRPAAIALFVGVITVAGAAAIGARIAEIRIDDRYGSVTTYEAGKERRMSAWAVAWRMRGSSGFPLMGRYHVRSVTDGRTVRQPDEDVVAENRELFTGFLLRQLAGSGCRNVHVEVGNGRFDAGSTCDTPDGDIHNIGYRLHGRFTVNSITVVADTTLWQHSLPVKTTVYWLAARQ